MSRDANDIIESLLSLIRQAEWSPDGTDNPDGLYCPWCLQQKKDGHTQDCEAMEAINAANEFMGVDKEP